MSDYFDEIMGVILEAERLGSQQLSTGVRLIGHVPHVAPEAYLHSLYPALDDEQVVSLEQQVGRSLTSELKKFLGRANGVQLFSDAFTIEGLRHSYVRIGPESHQPYSMSTANIPERPRDADPSIVFFGGYEWDGSALGMSPDSPVVYRFERGSTKVLNQWASFSEMLLSEVHRLSKLFDNEGRRISADTPTTPD